MNEENLKTGVPPEEEAHKLGRREAIKVGAAVAGGLALGMGAYIKPGMFSVGVQETYAATIETPPGGGGAGCTLGFWFDSPYGLDLWDNDYPEWYEIQHPEQMPPQYLVHGGLGKPFSQGDSFNGYFAPWPAFSASGPHGLRSMLSMNPNAYPGQTPAENAAVQLVTAVLNASWFGTPPYPKTVQQLKDAWAAIVNSSMTTAEKDAAFTALGVELDGYNNAVCHGTSS